MLKVRARLFAVAVATGLALSPSLAEEERAPCMRVAFVDMDRIVPGSVAVRETLEQADAELARLGERIEERSAELARFRAEYERQRVLLSSDGTSQRREEYQALAAELDRQAQAYDRERRIRERQLEPLMELIHDVVADVARREGIDIVLRGENVLFGTAAADLTRDVIAEVDVRREEVERLFLVPPPLTADVQADDSPTSPTRARRP
ncbi:MAG: OmpH family outer membrane protein [Candidatus Sumerlaeia bacterium]|nr:OmpH family outer membrane protein [Candidatus Sumerlaeia bacterium]